MVADFVFRFIYLCVVTKMMNMEISFFETLDLSNMSNEKKSLFYSTLRKDSLGKRVLTFSRSVVASAVPI